MESDNKTFSIASQFYHRPILIPHHPHPLIHCYHEKEKEFSCNNPDCKKNEGDSFRCTFCNYDICDKCFEEIELYKIIFYDEKKVKNKNPPSTGQDFGGLGWKNFSYHQHAMPTIVKKELIWCCSNCEKLYKTSNDIQNEEAKDYIVCDKYYYCSLCNYSLCLDCAKNGIKK